MLRTKVPGEGQEEDDEEEDEAEEEAPKVPLWQVAGEGRERAVLKGKWRTLCPPSGLASRQPQHHCREERGAFKPRCLLGELLA